MHTIGFAGPRAGIISTSEKKPTAAENHRKQEKTIEKLPRVHLGMIEKEKPEKISSKTEHL